jgi:methionyl-tRNA synthetase
MGERFYISTPIYYVNAQPHLGHAYTTIVADVMRRFHHLSGRETFFVTGTDEHGDKVLKAARAQGMTPQAYADLISRSFLDLWPRLNCRHDYFIRTTDEEHVRVVRSILQKVHDAGDIYFSSYEGLYCTGCERFYTERELEDGLCPQHEVPPEKRSEDNYFFRMSRYQQWLHRHIEEQPDFIRPERYRNEALAMLREPLEDLCISRPRSRLAWGIPLPFDENYVTYVWFDALINYVTALGYPDGEPFRRFWPYAQHLIAKDILKPHGIYWPTMLKAAGIPPYQHLNVHGYWNVETSKMSKSLGNVIRPLDLVEKYGLDAFRYFLLREMVFGLDASFSELALVQRLNADLANDLGNLLQRSLTMARRYLDGRVPAPGKEQEPDLELRVKADEVIAEYAGEMEGLGFHKALTKVWELISLSNRYIDRTEPFRLAKEAAQRRRLETVLYHILEVNRLVSVLLWPVMPDTSAAIAAQLGTRVPGERGDLRELGRWGRLEAGTRLQKPKALFPRVDLEKAGLAGPEKAAVQAAGGALVSGSTNPKETTMQEVTIETFQQIELRVAKVLQAQRLEGSDRLMRLQVDLGSEERQLIAGIAEHYAPEELIARLVVVVANLKPAKIFGQVSQGMLLAAADGKSLSLVTMDRPVGPGAKVR